MQAMLAKSDDRLLSVRITPFFERFDVNINGDSPDGCVNKQQLEVD